MVCGIARVELDVATGAIDRCSKAYVIAEPDVLCNARLPRGLRVAPAYEWCTGAWNWCAAHLATARSGATVAFRIRDCAGSALHEIGRQNFLPVQVGDGVAEHLLRECRA